MFCCPIDIYGDTCQNRPATMITLSNWFSSVDYKLNEWLLSFVLVNVTWAKQILIFTLIFDVKLGERPSRKYLGLNVSVTTKKLRLFCALGLKRWRMSKKPKRASICTLIFPKKNLSFYRDSSSSHWLGKEKTCSKKYPITVVKIIQQRIAHITNHWGWLFSPYFGRIGNKFYSRRKTHVCAQQIRVQVVFDQDLKEIRERWRQHNYQLERINDTIGCCFHFHFLFYPLREAIALKPDGDIQACLYRRTHLRWLRNCSPHLRTHTTLYESKPIWHYWINTFGVDQYLPNDF